MKENKNVVFVDGTPLTILGTMIKVGDTAPEFKAIDASMREVKLSDFKGKKIVITTFPSVDTKVCSLQLKHFNKESTKLDKDVVVLSISKDLPFALSRFCAAEGISSVHTLSDYRDSEFGEKYGFLIKENKLLARGVVIVNTEGKVAYVEYVKELTDEPDYKTAMDAVKKLK